MTLRTDLNDNTVSGTTHADQHNEANTAILALQEGGGGTTSAEFNISNNGVSYHGHLAQKDNGELVWGFNVDPTDDSIDDPSVGAWKMSMEGGESDYNGVHFQYSPPSDSWSGTTVCTLDNAGYFFIKGALTSNQADPGSVTAVATDTPNDATYALNVVFPGSYNGGIFTPSASQSSTDWTPFNAISTGGGIHVYLLPGVQPWLTDLVDLRGYLYVWDQSGTNSMSCSWSASVSSASNPSNPALSVISSTGSDLSFDDIDNLIVSTAGGSYNIMIRTFSGWD